MTQKQPFSIAGYVENTEEFNLVTEFRRTINRAFEKYPKARYQYTASTTRDIREVTV